MIQIVVNDEKPVVRFTGQKHNKFLHLGYCGFQVGTHKGAQNQFGQHFVMTGKFSLEDAKLYARLLNMREKADYNCSYKTDADEVMPLKCNAITLFDFKRYNEI